VDWWRIIHTLSLIWLGAGLGATYPLILKAWAAKDLQYQMYCLREAANNETRILLPGAMASGVTGFFWAASQNLNFFRTGWLLALWLLFIFFYLVCLPLLGFGLRRARLAALTAAKKGVVTPELREILDDRVPLVFSTILVISVPILAWLAVFKPF
jgi:signal transduction histidine kinase